METPSLSRENNADITPGSEDKILAVGQKAALALDKAFSQMPKEEKRDLRRWGEIGGFCAMLTGVKPALDTPDNWAYGKPLLEKIVQDDPSLKFAFDTINGVFVNRESLMQTIRDNSDYFPSVVNYDQAKNLFKENYHLGFDMGTQSSEDFTKRIVRTGLFLGYPKSESEKMARHIEKGFHQMYDLIEFANPEVVFKQTGISPENLKILRNYEDINIHHSQGLISQNLKKANAMRDQVKLILDQATGIDPELKNFFLNRRGFMFNQVLWIGYTDSDASIEAMKKIDSQFQQTGMKDVLVKHDIVLQGHSVEAYQSQKAA